MCRSRRELSNEYLLAKIGVDTAENEPLEVWGEIIQYYSFESLAEPVQQELPLLVAALLRHVPADPALVLRQVDADVGAEGHRARPLLRAGQRLRRGTSGGELNS